MAEVSRALRRMAADSAGIAQAVRLLRDGALVVLPTETVYGLAADAANRAAVAAIFAAKGRPGHNPLIVHVADLAMAERYAVLSPLARRLAGAFWPGPLTLVLPRRPEAPLAPEVAAGLPTLALRAPAHPAMRAVIARLGRGVAAPSANRSGSLSPTRAEHVRDLDVPLILDAGPAAAGVESTIVKVEADTAVLLRPGALPVEDIERLVGAPLGTPGAAIEAPGMLHRHYAPRKPLRLNARSAGCDEFLIGFGAIAGDLNLSPAADLAEAAAGLFHALHVAEASGAEAIAVAPVPAHGLGLAINDRLKRAAAAAPLRRCAP
ncbi:L-threonylcarbamoyladenylate synthase [Thermaurantiacus sp.]